MPRRLPFFALVTSQWMILAAIVLLAMLGVGYIRRVTESVAVQAELAQWEERVAVDRERQELLRERLAYVQTDAFIDEQARSVLGWVRPGDIPVEVIIEEVASPPTEIAPATRVASTPWRAWWALFFGP